MPIIHQVKLTLMIHRLKKTSITVSSLQKLSEMRQVMELRVKRCHFTM